MLDAARDVLNERGVAGLSMRSVASRLGVAPNALYSHVESRTALVDALLDDLLGHVPDPSPDADPATELRAVMLTSFDVLIAAPELVPSYLARQGSRGPEARRLGDGMRMLLERAGVRRPQEVIRVLIVHMLGFAALAASDGGPLGAADLRANLATGLSWLIDGALAGAS